MDGIYSYPNPVLELFVFPQIAVGVAATAEPSSFLCDGGMRWDWTGVMRGPGACAFANLDLGENGLGGLVAWVWCCGGVHGDRREPTLLNAPGCLYIQDRGNQNLGVLPDCSSLDLTRRTTDESLLYRTEELWRRIGTLCHFVEPLHYLYLSLRSSKSLIVPT